MQQILTTQELNLAKTYFDLFNTKPNGAIPDNETKMIVRAIGLAPTESAFKTALDKARDPSLGVTFDNLCEIILSLKQQNVNPYVELIDVFKYYDKENTGKIEKKVLIEQLTTVGEPLTKNQIEEVLQICNCNGDMIDYVEFTKKLLE